MTLEEIYHVYQAFYRPWAVPQELLAQRMQKGQMSLGQALTGGLLHAVLQRGIPISLETRAVRLLAGNAGIEGVAVLGPNRSEEHTSDPVTNAHLVCRLLLEKKKKTQYSN